MEQKNALDKIEKLILDGNKKVLERLDKLEDGQRTLEAGQRTLEAGQLRIEKKVERIDKTLDLTAQATYDLLTDVRKDVKQIEDKLDKHVQVLHPA